MNIFEGTHIKLDLKRHPNKVFFFKEDKFWMEYDWKSKDLWCRYEEFWEVLEEENHWDYYKVQAFIKDQVEQHFKCKGVTPPDKLGFEYAMVEQHFKCKGVTPESAQGVYTFTVEQHFKVKAITPNLF